MTKKIKITTDTIRDEINDEALKKLTPLELLLSLDILSKIQKDLYKPHTFKAKELQTSLFSCLSDREFSLLLEAVYEKFFTLKLNITTETEDILKSFFSPLGLSRDKTGLIIKIKLQYPEDNSLNLLEQIQKKIISLLKEPSFLNKNQEEEVEKGQHKNKNICPYAVGTDFWYVWHHQTPPIKSKSN